MCVFPRCPGFRHPTSGAPGRGHASLVIARFIIIIVIYVEHGPEEGKVSRGVTTRSQDQHRTAAAGVAPPVREEMPPPLSPSRGGDSGCHEVGGHGRNGAVGGGDGPSAPPRAPTPRPRAGSPSAPPFRRDEETSATRGTPTASRRSVPGLPGVHNRNDTLAMVRSLLDFPLTPDSP